MPTDTDSRRALLERMDKDRLAVYTYRYVPSGRSVPGAYLAGGAALLGLLAWRSPPLVRSAIGVAAPVILRDYVRPWLRMQLTSTAQTSKENDMGVFARTERELDRGIDDAKRAGRRASRELRATGREAQEDVRVNFNNLLADLEETLSSNSDTDIEALRTRLNAQIGKAREAADQAAGLAAGFVQDAVDTAEDHIRTRPLQSVGTAAGIAFLLGLLVGRR
ncbi:hypothetical protein BER2_0932 [plant metagenome]|uniref:DUF883 domain-containing protein n=1 Tax=plant metagenome TaxID=1297885 RepID=A0A484QZL0_9ZZZZ